MARLVAWISRNADGAIALVLAFISGVLGLADIMRSDDIEAAILIILALLATTLLRDRARSEAGEIQLGGVMRQTLDLLAAMPDKRRLAELQQTVSATRDALDAASLIRVLPGQEVSHIHAVARRDTDRWYFRGGTGTYLRAATLPECVAIARREKRVLKLQAEILDPADEQVCRRYAEYRRSLSPEPDGTGETWTTDRTRKESFATILAACWYRQHFTFLTVALGLTSTMSTFRWDMSARYLIITQEDPAQPALVADAGKPFYRACDRELQASLEQSRRVPVDLARDVQLSEEPTIDEARKLLRAVGLELPRSFGDDEVGDIIRRAIKPPNPYE